MCHAYGYCYISKSVNEVKASFLMETMGGMGDQGETTLDECSGL